MNDWADYIYISNEGCDVCMCSGKRGMNDKGDEEMGKGNKEVEAKKAEMRHLDEILNKGIERYDATLKKLSKN